MNFFEAIILNIILITFPLIFYSFYIAFNKNIGKSENNLFLDISLFTSFYLVMRFGQSIFTDDQLMIFNAILLIAYYKDRKFCAGILSFAIIGYYFFTIQAGLLFTIFEYLLYFLLFLIFKRQKISFKKFMNCFLILKTIFFFFLNYRISLHQIPFSSIIFQDVILSTILYISSYFAVTLMGVSEEIIKYHMSIKELEQEKQIKTTLFKITHEIKNPIAVCKGYLDMFDVYNINHSKKYVPILKEEINRTLILLQDFLSMRQIEIEKELLDINLLLEDVLNNFKLIFKEKDIKFISNNTDDEIYIDGDYNRLTQVLINVIKNSIEALENVGNAVMKVYVLEDKNNVVIICSDNGAGMTSDVLNRIGEPFYTTKMKGTGLGVSFSKEIINAHGGSIIYISKEYCGTTVKVTLPKCKLKLD